MRAEDFSRLFRRHGGYSLPVLVKLKQPGSISWHFTSSRSDVEWKGDTYAAVPVSYRPSASGGGTLEIDADRHMENGYELLRWFDEADDRAEMEITAVISENGEIAETGHLSRGHGSVSWDGRKITWNLGGDDRLQMQVNPWVFDADALAG